MSGVIRLLPPHDFMAYTETAKVLSDSQNCEESVAACNAPRRGGVVLETRTKFVIACQQPIFEV
jgi:hypothetical protein